MRYSLLMGRPRIRTDEDIKAQQRKARHNHRIKRWKICLEYLKNKECALCGEEDILVLEFDHCDGDKEYDISQMVSRSIGTYVELEAELKKCRVICRNCHVRHHHQQRNTLKWQYVQELSWQI